jgi:hypothetical protein
MAGSSRLGFQPGRSYHNAVLATMYIAVFVVITGIVIATVVMPLFSSSSSPSAAADEGGSIATSTPADSGGKAPQSTPQQTQPPSQATQGPLLTSTPGEAYQSTYRAKPSDEEFERFFKRHATNETDLTIVSIETQDDTVYVNMIPHNMSTRAFMNDVGSIAGSYAGTVKRWDVKKLQVTVLNQNHQSEGTIYIKTQWANQYRQGKISDREYLRRIINTRNPKETSRNETTSK